MKYIFLNPYSGFGGLEIQMIKRAEDAIKAGHEALVVTYPGTRAEDYCIKNKIPHRSLKILSRYYDTKAIYYLGKLFKEFDADLCIIGKTIHINSCMLARNIFFKKTALVLYQQMQSGVKKIDWFHNRLYRSLDGAVVIAEYMKHQLAKNTVFPFEKIAVIPCGIDIEKFNPKNFDKSALREKFLLRDDDFIVGCVARIEPQKDQMTLINALGNSEIKNFVLVLIGNIDDSEYFKKLQEKVTELKLSQRVKFLYFSNNIPELMNCFDVFVLPSLCETLGLVVIEAMAGGLPVVATRSGGVVEIIKENETGFFFEPAETEKLTEHLNNLYANPELRQIVGNQAMTDVKRFEYSIKAKEFLDYCGNCVRK